jgi:hypothetical protein
VAYFSAKHSAAECNYEIYNKKLLAIIKCLKKWRLEFQGINKPFGILINYKNLEYFTIIKSLNQRQIRWSEFFAGFNFKITYRPGNKAIRPNAFSRRTQDCPTKANPEDDRVKNRERRILGPEAFDSAIFTKLFDDNNLTAAFAELILPDHETPFDELINRAYLHNNTAQTAIIALKNPFSRRWPKFIRSEIGFAMDDCKIYKNRIYYKNRLFIPENIELKMQIIYKTHNSGTKGHPGRMKTTELVSKSYFWPKMTYDIQNYVKFCQLCKRVKAFRSAPPEYLRPLSVLFQAWQNILVDYITPLPICERNGLKYHHIAVVVCRLTKMRHFIPTTGLTAAELANAFVARIYALYEALNTIIFDRKTQFISKF